MWLWRRICTSLVACGLVFGCVFFIRLRLSDGGGDIGARSAPDFLPNVDRFRTSRVCSRLATLLVRSSPTSARRRQVIRETFAHPTVTQTLDISVAFGVGNTDNPDVQRLLDWESVVFGDVFLQDTSTDISGDSATGVTRLLEAARKACEPVPPQFFLKTDDDVFVNVFSLVKLLEGFAPHASTNTMWCLDWNLKMDGGNSARNDTWVVLTSEFSGVFHPKHCMGSAYLMTETALDAILQRHDGDGKAARSRMLSEDAYVTGTLAKEAGTEISLLGERFAFDYHEEEIDAGKVTFAYFGDMFEEATSRLWRVLAEERMDSEKLSAGL